MDELPHLSASGEAHMVDVSQRAETVRTARAVGRVETTAAGSIAQGSVPKGDVLAVARIAGIMAAKRTPELIPLCHPIALHAVALELLVTAGAVEIEATVRTADRTGVEMEALTAVTVAGLAIIDMVKALDPSATLTGVTTLSKSGGRRGDWSR